MIIRRGWRYVLVVVVLAVASAAAPTPAAGQWVDQQPAHGNGSLTDLTCGVCGNISYVVAESCTLDQMVVLEELVIWGGHHDNVSFTDGFSIWVYPDVGGVPGSTPSYSEAGVTPVAALTGAHFSGITDEVEYTVRLGSPPQLPAGTWWIEVANDSTSYSEDFVWEHGVTDPVHGASGSRYSIDGSPWYTSEADLAILLRSTSVFIDGFESGNTAAWSSAVP